MRTGVPCNENRFFPVGIDSQGVPCELYRVWVCSVVSTNKTHQMKKKINATNIVIFLNHTSGSTNPKHTVLTQPETM
jgi:hypothetical protein